MKIFLKYFNLLIGVALCWIAAPSQALAQDVNFSMFHLSHMQTNPAMIASSNQTKLMLNGRRRYIGGTINSYDTYTFSAMHPFVNKEGKRWGGIGLSFLTDIVGEGGLLRTNGVSLGFAYNFNLPKKHYISIGGQGGFFQRGIDAKTAS